MMSEGGDPLSLPFTSKTGQSHSVAQKQTDECFFFTSLASKQRTYFDFRLKDTQYRTDIFMSF